MTTRLLMAGFVLMLAACQHSEDHTQQLQMQIDSLQHAVAGSYKPGFGEFMSSIQVHHEKLWFAGQNANWKLADFEINEIKEALEDLQTYCTDRPERKSIPMIYPPLDSLSSAIQKKDPVAFRNSFIALTNNCNICHQATNHAFNVIRIPDSPPFSNQVFKPVEQK
ncbi:MAG TPA: hypothetical protein VMI35_06390 [Puia sp.]|nr:hypothetical protein [Puia sp.]